MQIEDVFHLFGKDMTERYRVVFWGSFFTFSLSNLRNIRISLKIFCSLNVIKTADLLRTGSSRICFAWAASLITGFWMIVASVGIFHLNKGN